VNSVLNLRVPWNAGKLSSGLTSSGLSSSVQLHRVSLLVSYGFLAYPTLRQSHSPWFSQLNHFLQRTSYKNISRNLRQLCNRRKDCIYSRSAEDFFFASNIPMSTAASSQNILASRRVAEYWGQTKRRSYEVTQLEGVFCARQNKERSLQCKKLRGRQRKKVCGYWICDVCCCIVSRVNKRGSWAQTSHRQDIRSKMKKRDARILKLGKRRWVVSGEWWVVSGQLHSLDVESGYRCARDNTLDPSGPHSHIQTLQCLTHPVPLLSLMTRSVFLPRCWSTAERRESQSWAQRSHSYVLILWNSVVKI
jgi:hypothetical protein